jgi:hypothetical protein
MTQTKGIVDVLNPQEITKSSYDYLWASKRITYALHNIPSKQTRTEWDARIVAL